MDPDLLSPNPDPAFQVNPDPDPIWIRIQDFDDQKLREKKIFTYPKASIKNVQTTEEAFSPQMRTSELQKIKCINFFLFLLVMFALLDPDPQHL